MSLHTARLKAFSTPWKKLKPECPKHNYKLPQQSRKARGNHQHPRSYQQEAIYERFWGHTAMINHHQVSICFSRSGIWQLKKHVLHSGTAPVLLCEWIPAPTETLGPRRGEKSLKESCVWMLALNTNIWPRDQWGRALLQGICSILSLHRGMEEYCPVDQYHCLLIM